MYTLFKYELRKITKKRLVSIALACLFLCIGLLSVLFIAESSWSDENGNIIKGPAAISLHKKQSGESEGYLTTDKMAQTLERYKTIADNPDNYTSIGAEGKSISNEVYGREIQKDEDVLDLLRRAYSPAGAYDYYILSSITPEDVDTFYDKRTGKIDEILNMDYSTGNYTQAEKEYFLRLNSEIETPFYFAYTQGWTDMLTRGFLSIFLIISFIVCICIAPVFASEYQTGTDSIVLSSRYGKNKVIKAKILSSIVFTTCVYTVSMLLFTVIMLAFHGVSGWNAPFQMASFTAPYPLTMLQVYLYGLAIGYVVIISIMAITLLFSAISKTSFAVVIIGALWVFVPMFIPSSKTSSLINNVIALLPAKATNAFEVFSVYTSYNLFGNILSLPTAIVIFSACIIAIALPLAYSRFKRHQVA